MRKMWMDTKDAKQIVAEFGTGDHDKPEVTLDCGGTVHFCAVQACVSVEGVQRAKMLLEYLTTCD